MKVVAFGQVLIRQPLVWPAEIRALARGADPADMARLCVAIPEARRVARLAIVALHCHHRGPDWTRAARYDALGLPVWSGGVAVWQYDAREYDHIAVPRPEI